LSDVSSEFRNSKPACVTFDDRTYFEGLKTFLWTVLIHGLGSITVRLCRRHPIPDYDFGIVRTVPTSLYPPPSFVVKLSCVFDTSPRRFSVTTMSLRDDINRRFSPAVVLLFLSVNSAP